MQKQSEDIEDQRRGLLKLKDEVIQTIQQVQESDQKKYGHLSDSDFEIFHFMNEFLRIQNFINNDYFKNLIDINQKLEYNPNAINLEESKDQLQLINNYKSINTLDQEYDSKNLSPKMNAVQQKQFKHLH